jgi:hypothetical protein
MITQMSGRPARNELQLFGVIGRNLSSRRIGILPDENPNPGGRRCRLKMGTPSSRTALQAQVGDRACRAHACISPAQKGTSPPRRTMPQRRIELLELSRASARSTVGMQGRMRYVRLLLSNDSKFNGEPAALASCATRRITESLGVWESALERGGCRLKSQIHNAGHDGSNFRKKAETATRRSFLMT